jgi:hypothetical protein
MRSPCCLWIPPPLTFEYLNQSLWNLVSLYHGTSLHLSCVLHKSLPSVYVSVCVYVPSLLGNGSVNTFPRQQIHATIKELLDVCVCGPLFTPLSLLGNNSVKTFPQQGINVGGIVFYVVRVISKESRRLILPRTSCFFFETGRGATFLAWVQDLNLWKNASI